MAVIASDTGKCIDYRVKSKHCASCTSWESRKSAESDLYEQFISKLDCDINHEASAGAMEVSGLIECFMESEKKQTFTLYKQAILEMEILSLAVKLLKKRFISRNSCT